MADETVEKDMQQAVLEHFAEYWRANYGDGCVLSNREWHLPKLQGAIMYGLRPYLDALAARTAERDEYWDALRRAVTESQTWRERLGWTRDAVQQIDAMMADAKRPNEIEHGVGPVEAVRALLSELATATADLEAVRRENAVLREALDEAMGYLPASAPDTCYSCIHPSCERRRQELQSVRDQIHRALAQEGRDA